jgi:hypothetical protein
MDMAALVYGIFGGVGATLIWELALKPRWDRRNVALLLSTEVSLNLQLLGACQQLASADKLFIDLSFGTDLYRSSLDRLGLLPPQAVRETVFLYRYFEDLNSYPQRYLSLKERLNSLPPDDPQRKWLTTEIRNTVAVFNDYVLKAINRASLTQPHLLSAARPWWHLSSHTDPKAKALDLEELSKLMSENAKRRAAYEALLRGERPPE